MSDRPIEPLFSAAEITQADCAAFLGALEWTAGVVWLSKTQQCRRATLRGVPAKRVDVIVDARIVDNTVDPRDVLVVAVVAKPGRFDGAVRPRIHVGVREGRHNKRDPIPSARLEVELDAERLTVTAAVGGDGWDGPRWCASFGRLRSDMNDYSPARVVMWHWRRYFGFLPEADAVALAESWALEMAERPAPPSLAEANRLASSALYRCARTLGWHKLTMRERERLGLHTRPQWIAEAEYAQAQTSYEERRRPDLSDATVAFASGVPASAWRYLDGDDL